MRIPDQTNPNLFNIELKNIRNTACWHELIRDLHNNSAKSLVLEYSDYCSPKSYLEDELIRGFKVATQLKSLVLKDSSFDLDDTRQLSQDNRWVNGTHFVLEALQSINVTSLTLRNYGYNELGLILESLAELIKVKPLTSLTLEYLTLDGETFKQFMSIIEAIGTHPIEIQFFSVSISEENSKYLIDRIPPNVSFVTHYQCIISTENQRSSLLPAVKSARTIVSNASSSAQTSLRLFDGSQPPKDASEEKQSSINKPC